MKLGELALNRPVPMDNVIILSNGDEIKNLKDLRDSLEKMGDDDFNGHVSKNHNDFKDWINESYGDLKLAKKIGKTRKRQKMVKIMSLFLKKSKRNDAHEINIPRRKKDILNQIRNIVN